MNFNPVIDADGHVNDWHLDWAKWTPAEYRDFVPRSFVDENGWRQIEVDGQILPGPGRPRVSGGKSTRPANLWRSDRIGQEDPGPRLPDMDEMEIDVSVLFGGHCFLVAAKVEDPRAAKAAIGAYNNWLADYTRYAPNRLKGVAMMAPQDPAWSAGELRRQVTDHGFVAGVLPPHHINGMMLNDASLDPIYAEAERLNVPLCIHTLGIQINPAAKLLDGQIMRSTYGGTSSMFALGSLIIGGVLDRFPNLTFAFLEAGVGWVPYIMDRLQWNYTAFGSTDQRIAKDPEEYVRSEQLYFAADPDEPTLGAIASVLGAERLVIGSDYCHPEGMCPETMRFLAGREDLGPDVRRKILSENPGRLYRIS